MKNVPKTIYLVVGFGADDGEADFKDLEEVTWSRERINDADIEYHINENQEKGKIIKDTWRNHVICGDKKGFKNK